MVRHGNVKNLANEAIDAEYGHEDQQDLYYGNEYDDEEYYEEKNYAKANKKAQNNMAYEDDLEDDDLQKAIAESKKSKKKKAKNTQPDQVLVDSITEQFGGYFTQIQVKDYLLNAKNDIDMAIQALANKKEQNENKGKTNKKKEDYEKMVEKQIEEEKKQTEEKKKKEIDKKYANKEKDYELFQQVSPEVLNKQYEDVDYGVQIDMEEQKKNINMVIIGHVDAGKSTLMGHLLYKMGQIDAHKIRKNAKMAEEYGKATFEFAYVMDEDEEERRRGITINTAQAFFQTKSKNFTIIDAPGHMDFISNMISGASKAECGILMIDARTNTFERAFDVGQTRDHAILARSLGVTQLCVGVNKLDTKEWSEKRYDEICEKIAPFLKSIGFKDQNVQFVPMSGLHGINLDSRSTQPEELKAWYNDVNGATNPWKKPLCLLEILDNFKSHPKPYNKPTRVCIYDIFSKMKDGFSVTSGDCFSTKVESGVVQEKQRLLLLPQNEEVLVKAIECQKKKVAHAISGQLCEVSLQLPNGFDVGFIRPGSVLCDLRYPIHQVRKFKARIIVYDITYPIVKGQHFILYSFSHKIPGKITSIDMTLDQKNNSTIKERPKKLIKGNFAQVTIKLEQRICLELVANNKAMGRIALRDGEETIAAGVVIEMIS